MTTQVWLREATNKLSDVGIESTRLDCLILLEYITKRDRTWILAHQDISLDESSLQKLNLCLQRRLKHEPIAYITGHKEFAGLDLLVTPKTLIPRPETEQLIEIFDSLEPKSNWQVHDVGTGCGALALAIKKLWPSTEVSASDISPQVIEVASKNAKNHNLEINFQQTDLLNKLGKFNVITANMPYVDKSWSVSPETAYEPPGALYAAHSGLEIILRLLDETPAHLLPDGYLIMEHDPRQNQAVAEKSLKLGYKVFKTSRFATCLQLV